MGYTEIGAYQIKMKAVIRGPGLRLQNGLKQSGEQLVLKRVKRGCHELMNSMGAKRHRINYNCPARSIIQPTSSHTFNKEEKSPRLLMS